MKSLAIAAFVLSASFAQASDLACRQAGEDGVYAATFKKANGVYSKVRLSIPTGETSSKQLDGICMYEEGAIELSVRCEVSSGMESGYTVMLQSIGSSTLVSSVQKYSMARAESPIAMKCGDEN